MKGNHDRRFTLLVVAHLILALFLLFESADQLSEERQLRCIMGVKGLNVVPAELEDICGSLR